MLTLVEGAAGAGKTIFVIERFIIPELKSMSGRKIITNIPLDIDMLSNVFGDIVTNTIYVIDEAYDVVSAYQNSKGEFLVGYHFIIDECQEHFTSDQFDDTDVSKYFSRHRKYFCDITMLTQNPALISRKLRGTIEVCHYLAKRRVIGGSGYTLKSYAGRSNRGTPTNKLDGQYDPSLYQFYRSYSAEGFKEISQVKPSLATKLFVLIYKNLVPVFIFLLTMSLVFIYRSFTHKPEKVSVPVASVSAPVSAPVPPPPAASAPVVPVPVPAPVRKILAEYPGRVASEVCGLQDGTCEAVIYNDDGTKSRITHLALLGHTVTRLSPMTWRIDDAIAVSFHMVPEAKTKKKSEKSDKPDGVLSTDLISLKDSN